MKKLHPIYLTIVSALLLWLSWPTSPLTPLVFFGFVPVFLLADVFASQSKFFASTYLAMFLWNLLTTWWIVNASLAGAAMAIIANSFLMCLPWWGYHIFKQKFSRRTAYFAFICFWMLFEYNHLNWQLSWPWLNLGNVFASQPDWVQWYEFTGIAGGTLWVLLVNVLVYEWMFGMQGKSQRSKVKKSIGIVSMIFIPIGVSTVIEFSNIPFKQFKQQVLIVQPNIDPYSKFEASSIVQQVQTHLQLTQSSIDSNTRLVVWPETALAAGIPIDQTEQTAAYQPVLGFISQHPNLTLLTGIETMRWYNEKPASPYARKTEQGYYYDSYNAAVSIKTGQPLQYYIKSKLVPGVETLPTYLNFLGPVFEQFGGTTGGYAKDTASTVFYNAGNPFITAPIICYESIYGEYVASYVNKGANLLTIITNDGWWGNTPGHKQHLHYARLRAIETRTWVARSANTGISAVVDNYGKIQDSQPWDKASVIKFNIPVSSRTTFYVKHGDYLYLVFSLLAGLLVLWNLLLWLKNRFSA